MEWWRPCLPQKIFVLCLLRSCDLGRYFYPVRRLNAPKEAYRFIAAIKKNNSDASNITAKNFKDFREK